MTNGFPGLVTVPENADVFAAEEFTPSSSASLAVSVQIAASLMNGDASANYTVMGSNISALVGDMVPVKDEAGISGALAVNVPWVRNNFPFKFIGIQYSHNTNAGTGTFSVTIEKKAQLVKVS